MDILPPELLTHVLLFIRDDSRRDLLSTSLVNREYRHVAIPLIYEDLFITFRDGPSLRENVSQLTQDGLGRHYLTHARRLEVMCIRDCPYMARREIIDLWNKKDVAVNMIYLQSKVISGSFLQQFLTAYYVPGLESRRYEPIYPEYYHHKDWEPLNSLVSELRHLQELDYCVGNMFPTSLYHTIQRHHPHCRLNIFRTQLASLDIPGQGRPDKSGEDDRFYEDPFGPDILHSSALSTLALEYSLRVRHDQMEYELFDTPLVCLDGPLHLLSAARNLKHLILQLTVEDTGEDSESDFQQLNDEWRQHIERVKPKPAAQLQSLAIKGEFFHPPWEAALLKVSDVLDLWHLHSLDIQVFSDPSALEKAANLLPNLKRLSVAVELYHAGHPDPTGDHPDMVAAILAFSPLEFLCLRDVRSGSALQRIISRHGPTLKGLIVEASFSTRQWSKTNVPDSTGHKYPPLTSGDIAWLAENAPNIQELRLPIERHSGPVEHDMFKAIGNFSCLHSLILDLACSHLRTPFRGYNHGPEMIEVFANAAVDKNLVCSIWKIIFSSQQSRRLRNLRCGAFDNQMIASRGFAVLHEVCRSFLARRPNFETLEPDEIVEVGRREWELMKAERGDDATTSLRLQGKAQNIVDALWPQGEGDGTTNWTERWHSFF